MIRPLRLIYSRWLFRVNYYVYSYRYYLWWSFFATILENMHDWWWWITNWIWLQNRYDWWRVRIIWGLDQSRIRWLNYGANLADQAITRWLGVNEITTVLSIYLRGKINEEVRINQCEVVVEFEIMSNCLINW